MSRHEAREAEEIAGLPGAADRTPLYGKVCIFMFKFEKGIAMKKETNMTKMNQNEQVNISFFCPLNGNMEDNEYGGTVCRKPLSEKK